MSTATEPESMPLPISTVILAGGLGTRIGGAKGLQSLRGRPLIEWVLDAVATQSDDILLNVNGACDSYLRFGCRIIADQTPGWAGPLAGVQSALRCARHEWLACIPCDTPYLPHDLLRRLYAAIQPGVNDAAVAVAEGTRHPTVALYHKRVLPCLDSYLNFGGRKVTGWQDTLRLREVAFYDASAFTNINSQHELSEANRMAFAPVP